VGEAVEAEAEAGTRAGSVVAAASPWAGVAHGPRLAGGWHGGGWHGGGWHGHHHGFGSSVFIGGSFFYPWYYPAYPYYSYPYSYPYAYPYAYALPPPDDSEWEAGPPRRAGEDEQDDDSTYADARSASYGSSSCAAFPTARPSTSTVASGSTPKASTSAGWRSPTASTSSRFASAQSSPQDAASS
jgi:hypothetical protein